MVARTRDNSFDRADARARTGNPAAFASVLVGLVAVLAMPAAYVIQYYSQTVTLLQSTVSAAFATVLGLWAILLARRGGWTVARTIGRSGGAGAAKTGKLLGWLAFCAGISAGLAVGFYGLLTIFAKS
jgi:hypothetical protein